MLGRIRSLPRDLPRLLTAVLFLFIGLGSATLAVGSRERGALVGLTVYGLGLAGWTLFHTRTKQLWLADGAVWLAVWWISVPLLSTGLALSGLLSVAIGAILDAVTLGRREAKLLAYLRDRN